MKKERLKEISKGCKISKELKKSIEDKVDLDNKKVRK